MERCPVCNARFKESICYRCGSDLAQLVSIETQTARLEARALKLFAFGDLNNAQAMVEQGLTLKRSPRLLTLLNLILDTGKTQDKSSSLSAPSTCDEETSSGVRSG